MTAMARSTAAQETASRPTGRNEYVWTIKASGSAGKTAASTAKITSRTRRLPAGPNEAKRPSMSSSRDAIRRPSEETADVDHRHGEDQGPADDLAVVVQRVRARLGVHVRQDERGLAVRGLLRDMVGHRRIEEVPDEDDALAVVRRIVDAHDLRVPQAVRSDDLPGVRTVRDRDDIPRDAHERVPAPEQVRD